MQLLSDLSNTEAVARLRAGDEEVFTRLYHVLYSRNKPIELYYCL